MRLTAESVPAYLRAQGVAPPDDPIEVAALGGGVSCVVFSAWWSDGAIVVKQPLDRLRVAADWEWAPARVFVERDCLEVLHSLLPGAAPRVVFCDEANFVLGMTAAPPGGRIWRDQLADGRLDDFTVKRAAALLGRLQDMTRESDAIRRRFGDQMPLIDGRLKPFHHEIAHRHPDLASRIQAEISRTLATRTVLVHGDYSPKNIIAYPADVMILDCEVAHWGDPAFDPAFLLCHLLLDGAHRGHLGARYARAADMAWCSFRAAGGRAVDDHAVVAELGCLILARVDGKSPLSNLVGERGELVRSYGRHLIQSSGETSVSAALSRSVAFFAGEPVQG